MKKIKLYSIGNYNDFNRYEFDKKTDVIDVLLCLFSDIFDLDWRFCRECEGEIKEINIEKYVDKHNSYTSEELKIDIFFGHKKMFVTIICSQKLRVKFNEALGKVSEMPEPVLIKPKKKRKKSK